MGGRMMKKLGMMMAVIGVIGVIGTVGGIENGMPLTTGTIEAIICMTLAVTGGKIAKCTQARKRQVCIMHHTKMKYKTKPISL